MAELSQLSQSEFEKISDVLKRDLELRSIEEARIRELKQELHCLRKQAALKPGLDPLRKCARCLNELGRIINRGALCPLCFKRVCKECRQYEDEKPAWICIYCYKQMQLKAISGDWMRNLSQSSGKDEVGDRIRRLLQTSLQKESAFRVGQLDNVELCPAPDTPPLEKPQNLFFCEYLTAADAWHSVEIDERKDTLHTEAPNVETKGKQDLSKSFTNVSPWTGIDPEPRVPVRINRSRPLSANQPDSLKSKSYITSGASYPDISGRRSLPTHRNDRTENDLQVPLLEGFGSMLKAEAVPELKTIYNRSSSLDKSNTRLNCRGASDVVDSTENNISSAPKTDSSVDNNFPTTTHPDQYASSQSDYSEAGIECKSSVKTSPLLFSKVPSKKHKSEASKVSETKSCDLPADESGNSLRSSPHGRMRMRNRSLSGGSEDGRQRKSSVSQISLVESTEPGCQSNVSCEKDGSSNQEEDTDPTTTYHCRSQMSLLSFGGRSESVTSVYSAAGGGRYGTVMVTGDVLFGLSYCYKTAILEINVKECRNLAAVDTKRNRSDPYVKVYLLPDRTKGGKRKTKVKKHTLNPVFDEILKFHITLSELEIRTLWLSVWHSDRFGRNDFLGEVMLPLSNDPFENIGLKWYPLQERLETLDAPVTYKGDLILALKYVPPDVTSRKLSKKPGSPVKGALTVLVREARNLMATRSNGTSDPFCKSYLLPDKSKAGKQKTSVFKKSCNPKWNHTFVYDDVSLEELKERCLELTIWDYDKITSNDFLGGVRLCLGTGKYQGRDVDWMDSVGEERSLWYTMLERPNAWVDGSLLLRPNMQNRRSA